MKERLLEFLQILDTSDKSQKGLKGYIELVTLRKLILDKSQKGLKVLELYKQYSGTVRSRDKSQKGLKVDNLCTIISYMFSW